MKDSIFTVCHTIVGQLTMSFKYVLNTALSVKHFLVYQTGMVIPTGLLSSLRNISYVVTAVLWNVCHNRQIFFKRYMPAVKLIHKQMPKNIVYLLNSKSRVKYWLL